MANDPAENRDVRGNDINPATIGARDPPDSIHTTSLNNVKTVSADASNPASTANDLQDELFGSNAYGDTGGRVVFESPHTHTADSIIDLVDGVMLSGESVRGSALRADSTFSGEAMIRFRPDATTFFTGIEWLRIDGNEPNGASTKGIVIDGAGGGEPNDMHCEHLIIRNTAEEGLLLEHVWGHRWNEILVEGCGTGDGTGSNAAVDINAKNQSGKEQLHCDQWFVFGNHADIGMVVRDSTGSHPMVFQDIWVRNNDYLGLLVRESDTTWIGTHIQQNSQADLTNHDGWEVSGNRTTILGGQIDGKNDQQRGLLLNSNDSKVIGLQEDSNDFIGLGLNGNRNLIVGCRFNSGIRVNGGADNEFWGLPADTTFSRTDGTRTRWNGWIGGGPLGGVDLSTTTGQFEGDKAVADGTSASANAGDLSTWDSVNSQWRVHQHEATV